jgi:hypothetical protein
VMPRAISVACSLTPFPKPPSRATRSTARPCGA